MTGTITEAPTKDSETNKLCLIEPAATTTFGKLYERDMALAGLYSSDVDKWIK